MTKFDSHLPLLPLLLDGVPATLVEALAQEGVPCEPHDPRSPRGRFVLTSSRLAPVELADGQIAIPLRELQGHGPDPAKELADESAARCAWSIEGLEVEEVVARVDRARVRRNFLARLRGKIEKLGGVWMRVAAFPHAYRSSFTLRLDHDAYIPDDFDATLTAIRGREHCVTHFLTGSAFAGRDDALERLRGQDVQPHGWRHHTYQTFEENHANVARCVDWLRSRGFRPQGFAAPHGRWNRGLDRAMHEAGLNYGSEFAVGWDDAPFFPQRSNVLQIPIHPLSLGVFLEAARLRRPPVHPDAAADVCAAWLLKTVRERHAAGGHVVVYDHPDRRLGKFPFVLQELWGLLDSLRGVWLTNMSELAAWERARREVRLQVHRRNDAYTVLADFDAGPHLVAIEFCSGGRFASLGLETPVVRFRPGDLRFQRRAAPTPPKVLRVDRPESWREYVKRQIDWEKETPAEEIGDRSWRGWTKWLVRSFQPSTRGDR